MKGLLVFLTMMFVIGYVTVASAGHENQNRLYRNDEYQFRIKFPVGWELKNGDGKRIVKKAVDTKSLSAIAISATKLPGNVDLKDYSQKELDEFLLDSINEIRSKYPDVKIIEKGIRHLDNKKAIYLKYTILYKTLDKTLDLITLQYTTIYKGNFYSIGGGAPVAIFNSQERLINKSIASFVFEEVHADVRDIASFQKSALATYRDDTYKFIFQYPKTWSPVPPTHKGTKIKVVNKNGSGDADCGVNVQYDESLKGLTSKQAIATISNPQIFEKAMRTSLPDATVIKSGGTYLSNQEAFYTITKFTHHNLDVEIPMKMFLIQTVKGEYAYTIACRTSQERFDEILPVFRLMVGGFVFKP